ncbi:glycosyltransferase family 2 protein [Pseudobutyrivibrio sp. MD2005]|uniref:glycosyltransferase family 2 protein n=1 Tax=Pseudobutyrivibrio sp. MD2005 TaxID=1410616 RepID=UPI000683EC04|nr:glycosyltransferase family 2 protein [Pseudobutyrivibrio sp. MD2005]
MISVIIPVYNVEKYLREAIDSVLNQTYKDIEIILVDDGSTDSSDVICDEYFNKYNNIMVIHQNNAGLSAARNAGLDICKGEIISFLDPDDAFETDMLSKMHEAMIENNADIVECNYIRCECNKNMGSTSLGRKKNIIHAHAGLYSKQEAARLQLEGKIAPAAWNKIYKRHIWDNLRFREGQNFEDRDIVLPLLSMADSIYVIDEPLVLYRERNGSISRCYSYDNVIDFLSAFDHYYEFVASNNSGIFKERDINQAALVRYRHMISIFIKIAGSRINDKKRCIALVKNKIKNESEDIDIKNCGVRLRAATHLALNLPAFLFTFVYKIYRPFRLVYLKVAYR